MRFHFIDKTGLRLVACRRYVHAAGGQRVRQAMLLKRVPSRKLIGISSFLASMLRLSDVLVLDSLAVYKIDGRYQWLAECGVQVLFLPPYLPGFSPIEQAWSKFKTAAYTAQTTESRVVGHLDAAAQAIIDWIANATV